MSLDDLIRGKLHVKRGDPLPYTGWSNSVSRVGLAGIMAEAGFTTGAEIGVRKGYYSRTLCDTIPNLRLTCVDPWAPWSGGRPSQDRQDAYFAKAQQVLAGFDVTFLRKTSMEALADVADGSLDFVYIDALHYFDHVMMDIIHWANKVRPGGLVAGHDYVENPSCGVISAVRAYTSANSIQSWYLTHEEPTAYEPYPSWFWVKQ